MNMRNSRSFTYISWSSRWSPSSHFTLRQEKICSHCLHTNDLITANTAGWPLLRHKRMTLWLLCNTIGYAAWIQTLHLNMLDKCLFLIYLVAFITFQPNWSILSSFALWKGSQNQNLKHLQQANRDFFNWKKEVKCVSKQHSGTPSSHCGCPWRFPSQIRSRQIH